MVAFIRVRILTQDLLHTIQEWYQFDCYVRFQGSTDRPHEWQPGIFPEG
jgi:hypothetical protein